MRDPRQGDTSVGPTSREGLEGRGRGDHIGAAAAVLLWELQAQQAQLAHLAPAVDEPHVVAVALDGAGGDLLGRKLADGLDERPLVLVQVEVHGSLLTSIKRTA